MDNLLDLLAKHSIRAPVEWNGPKPTRDGAQWFIGKSWQYKDKEYFAAWFGDYKTGLKVEWKSHEKYTAAEKKEADRQLAGTLAAESAAREKEQIEIAKAIWAEFDNDSVEGRTPYMDRKLIKELYGARVRPNENGDPILVVPLRDTKNRVWNVQRIYSQKLSKGDKFFSDGARIDGLFHVLRSGPSVEGSEFNASTPIYICEGFATAASILQSLGESATVVAAFTAGNLGAVAKSLREHLGNVPIIICADNDAYTTIDGKPVNVGLIKGRGAAGAVGGSVTYPIFKYPQKGLTDFNDLHAAEGLDRVKDQILNPGKYRTEIEPLITGVTDSGRPKKPTEEAVVNYILKFYGDNITKHETNLFLFTGTHWKEFEERDHDLLKRRISLAGNHLTYKDTMSCYRMFLVQVSHVPGGRNIYQPNPYAANFINGTLYLTPKGGLTWSPQHNRHDYLTHVLPFNCPDINSEVSPAPLFDNWLARIWQGDADIEAKVRLYHQLMGACLCPAYPNITFFIGPPNSGKSTLVKMLVKMVNLENTSQVQLSDMDGFSMAPMLNKLVNFDTELELKRPIKDVFVKKIIDRMPFTVKRKFESDVLAFLPAVHLFAANSVPVSLDGESQAYGRRIIVVRTEKLKLEVGEEQYDFEQTLWEAEGQGIVGRAVHALKELHGARGRFVRPASSAEHVTEMQLGSDIVGQFLEDAKHGEADGHNASAVLGEELSVKPSELWNIFDNWREQNVSQQRMVRRYDFYKLMRQKGFDIRGVNGVRTFRGIGSIIKVVKMGG